MDRLDCGGCLSSALYWLPFNEVLRAPCWGLQNLQYALGPAWGNMGAFSLVFISHPFPCARVSQTLFNYHIMCWNLSALHSGCLCPGKCGAETGSRHPACLLGVSSPGELRMLETAPCFKSTPRCTWRVQGASSEAAGTWENPVHMSRALICRLSHCELRFHLYTEGSFMTRLLEQINLTPMTKGDSSLREDPSIQMDASTQKFRKSVTLCSFYPKIRGEKSTQTLHCTYAQGWAQVKGDLCCHQISHLKHSTFPLHLSSNVSWQIPKPAG